MKPSMVPATPLEECDARPTTGMQHESLKALALKLLARNKAMRQAGNNENVLRATRASPGPVTTPDKTAAPPAHERAPVDPAVWQFVDAFDGEVVEVEPSGEPPEVLTLEDLPALANRLRAQGWLVKRLGDELDCIPRRPWHRTRRKGKRGKTPKQEAQLTAQLALVTDND